MILKSIWDEKYLIESVKVRAYIGDKGVVFWTDARNIREQHTLEKPQSGLRHLTGVGATSALVVFAACVGGVTP